MIVGDTEIRSLTEVSRRNFVALRGRLRGHLGGHGTRGRRFGCLHCPDIKLATFALLQMCTGVSYWYSPRGRLSLDSVSDGFVGMALQSASCNISRVLSAETATRRKCR